mmetsp:Transcript_18260/g.32486  ORF Transcript_18260/g.32486 Transcript_18260/m.32486 type:complete len:82 (+) Transcript_18260:1939-2184(+)
MVQSYISSKAIIDMAFRQRFSLSEQGYCWLHVLACHSTTLNPALGAVMVVLNRLEAKPFTCHLKYPVKNVPEIMACRASAT